MIRPLTTIILILLLLPARPALADDARFDADSGQLSLDCVYIPALAGATYSLELGYNGAIFELISINEITQDPDCSNVFAADNNQLTAQVRVVDDIYELVLQLGANNQFDVLGVTHVGRGPTSLWRVSNGVNEVLLGGTIHVLKQSDFPLPALFDEAFAQADILVTELDREEYLGIQEAIQPYLYIDAQQSPLSQVLSPQLYQQIQAFLSNYNLSVLNYENFNPNWLAQDINSLALSSLGYGAGVDQHFIDRAFNEALPNWGLETADYQFSVLSQTNQHLSSEELLSSSLSYAQSPELETYVRRLIHAWREGDVEFISEELLAVEEAENPGDYFQIYTRRNANWIPQIEEFLQTAELELVLVGVAHMAGSDSVIAMLEERGYSVSPY